MTSADILEQVRSQIVELSEVDPAAIHPEATLTDDLALDSIDAIDLAVKMQDITGRRVSEASLRKLRTVGDIVNLVERMLRGETE